MLVGQKRNKTKYEVGDTVKFIGRISQKAPQAFPKNNAPFSIEEYSILRFDVVSTDEKIPIPINFYGNITVDGYNLPHDYREHMNREYYIIAKVKNIHPKYGYSFQSVMCSENLSLSSNEATQRKFFRAILTDRQFTNLFAVYDKPLTLVVNKNTEKLLKVKGLGEVTVKALYAKYESNKAYIKAYIELADYEMSGNAIKKIVDYYHSAEVAVEVITHNPYKLVEITGFSFIKADEIARTIGLPIHSLDRLRAYILFILSEAYNDGYSYLESGVVIDYIEDDYGALNDTEFTLEEMGQVINDLKEDGILLDDVYGIVGLKRYYRNEEKIAREFRRIIKGQSNLNKDKEIANRIIKTQEQRNGWEFSEKQKDGIYFIMDNEVGIVTGRGGCVDSETEYFNGKQWKKICDYTDGEQVMQYTGNDKELVDVQQYHKYKLENKEPLIKFDFGDFGNQVLSLKHRVIYKTFIKNDLPELKEITVDELLKLSKEELLCIHIPIDTDYSINSLNWINVGYWLESIEILFPKQLEDNNKYCFTVPSGMLILRREGRIFITGNSGKTSIADTAIKCLNTDNVRLACLSGKAAARIQEVSDFQASTIHRLLGYSPEGRSVDEVTNKILYFTYHKKNKLPYDVILIDEFSMTDSWLLLSLLEAINSTTKLIFLGDISQLNAIQGAKLGVEMVDSNTIPMFELTEIFRQKNGSQIKAISTQIAQGKQLYHKQYEGIEQEGEIKDLLIDVFLTDYTTIKPTADKTFKYYKQALKLANGNPKNALMITTVTTRGESSVYKLNEKAQEYLNPIATVSKTNGKNVEFLSSIGFTTDKKGKYKFPFYFRLNDRVMIIKNDYNTMEVELINNRWEIIYKPELTDKHGNRIRTINDDAVFNGFGGNIVDATYNNEGEPKDIIMYVDDIDKYILIPNSLWYSSRALVLFYACTTHKFQGSEVDYAVLTVSADSWHMLNRQILYVMLSRAKKQAWLVAENKALSKAIATSETISSQAYLRHLLDYGNIDNILNNLNEDDYEDDYEITEE